MASKIPLLSDADRARVEAAVRASESSTSAEIVCMVVRHVFDPRLLVWGWTALAALLLPWLLLWFTRAPALDLLLAQLLALVLLPFLLEWLGGLRALLPQSLVRRRVRAEALREFAAHGLAVTEGRTGVLIFVALAERRVDVVVDRGIAARVPQSLWDTMVASITGAVVAGRLAGGLVAAIEAATATLAEHAPPSADNRNELPDVILDA